MRMSHESERGWIDDETSEELRRLSGYYPLVRGNVS